MIKVNGIAPWCDYRHSGSDHPDDRQHGGFYLDTALQTMPYDNYGTKDNPQFKPVTAMVNLVQHYRELEPRICFGDSSDQATYYMTVSEAEKIALDLLTLVIAGRRRTEIIEPLEAISPTPGCQFWCRNHDAAGICDSGTIDGARLTYDKNDGAHIWFEGYGDDGLTVDKAERLAHSILNIAVIARRSRHPDNAC